jgi:glycopeptide antibiotics resistance protein
MTGPRTSTSGSERFLPALFAVYLLLLVWIVLWKLEVPWVGGVQRVVKLVPFVPSAGSGASAPSEVVINLLLFVPFGVYLGLVAPSWPWWKIAVALSGSSLALEVVQYVLAIGSSDITDVVVNTAGGLAGWGLLVASRRRRRGRTGAGMVRICSIGTALALVAAVLVIASPFHDGSPGGVHVPPRSPPTMGAGQDGL